MYNTAIDHGNALQEICIEAVDIDLKVGAYKFSGSYNIFVIKSIDGLTSFLNPSLHTKNQFMALF